MQSWRKKKTTDLKMYNKNKTNIISHEIIYSVVNVLFCAECICTLSSSNLSVADCLMLSTVTSNSQLQRKK
jgi:hypothetical protein